MQEATNPTPTVEYPVSKLTSLNILNVLLNDDRAMGYLMQHMQDAHGIEIRNGQWQVVLDLTVKPAPVQNGDNQ